MKVLGLVWLGTRTDRFQETASFFENVLGFTPMATEDGVHVFALPNADVVEVFSADRKASAHLSTGPVIGFLVPDLDDARSELSAAGVEILHEGKAAMRANRWFQFRAPDGNIYEIVEDRDRLGATGV
ncbi:MAG: VOC family protein [Candidatus Dormibacteraeota bacterium]|nr:VOC family protein [Candidatus Dormibacteraeota bacterium]MBV9524478.1 VOC family protein [Candidatus Dormibacteraeota bacterium]